MRPLASKVCLKFNTLWMESLIFFFDTIHASLRRVLTLTTKSNNKLGIKILLQITKQLIVIKIPECCTNNTISNNKKMFFLKAGGLYNNFFFEFRQTAGRLRKSPTRRSLPTKRCRCTRTAVTSQSSMTSLTTVIPTTSCRSVRGPFPAKTATSCPT